MKLTTILIISFLFFSNNASALLIKITGQATEFGMKYPGDEEAQKLCDYALADATQKCHNMGGSVASQEACEMDNLGWVPPPNRGGLIAYVTVHCVTSATPQF